MPARRLLATRLNLAILCALGPSSTALGCGSSEPEVPIAGAAGASSAGNAGVSGLADTAGSAGTIPQAGNSAGGGANGGSSGPGACLAPEPALSNDDPTTFPAANPTLANQTHHYFKIVVRDSASNAPLAGAKLTTVNDVVLTSDQNGVVAFYEPGLMGLSVWFSPARAGYQYPADGLGNRGKALLAVEGGAGELRLDKVSDAAVPAQGDLQSRLVAGAVPGRAECTAIRVFDQQNQRGVPAVQLSAFGEDYWSDSQGLVAYCNPDHQGAGVSFTVFAHGYALADGKTSVTLATSKGGTLSVKLARQSIGERLYRLIGGGVYRDSVLLGLQTPLAQPTLNGQVLGSDTASATVYRGKLFWLWQDTNQVAYPLGNFRGTAATSLLPGAGGLSQNLGVDFTYIVGKDGFAAAMCLDCQHAPVWIDGLISVPDAAGSERLFAGYASVDGTGTSVETGLLRFDDAKQAFQPVLTNFLGRDGFQRPGGHPFQFQHEGTRYAYMDARQRIVATSEAFLDPDHYEQFSPYDVSGSTTLLQNPDGTLNYQWRKGARHVTSDALKSAKISTAQDLDGHELDVATGVDVSMVGRSVAWNASRQRFVQSSQQLYGSSSPLGEIWHAEADTPMGPFVYAAKVISHQNYTFYNVLHHPEFDRGPFMYLEGTYTATYTNAAPSPRYNYNQQLFRIDLSDARLSLPVAVYELGGGTPGNFGAKAEVRRGSPALSAAFLAPDRLRDGLIPVAWSGAACAPTRHLLAGTTPPTRPLFYALAPSTKPVPPHAVPLYEYTDPAKHVAYGLQDAAPAGYTRAATPLAYVWENLTHVKVPVADYLGDLIADAGPDQCVAATGALTQVTLDASASSSLAGTVVQVRWHLPNCDVSGTKITAQLAPGMHDIEVEVTDSAGNHARDHVIIDIE